MPKLAELREIDGAMWARIECPSDSEDPIHILTDQEVAAIRKDERAACVEVISWFSNVEKFTAADVIARLRATTGGDKMQLGANDDRRAGMDSDWCRGGALDNACLHFAQRFQENSAMKPYVCKHGHRVGYFEEASEVKDGEVRYRLKWHYCGTCCDEIAAHQIAVAAGSGPA
jgi:hypothetical protein